MQASQDPLLSRLKLIHEPKGCDPPVPVYPVIPLSPDLANLRITVQDVQDVVARYYKLSHTIVYGDSTCREYSVPRHVAMYLSVELTGRSSTYIGSVFKRDYSSVLHGHGRIKKAIPTDVKLAAEVRAMVRELCANEGD